MKRLLLIPPLLVASTASAADLHVGAGQTYSNVQDAIDAAAAGDNILVHGGSYTEDLQMQTDGSMAAPIALQLAGDGDATITGRIRLQASWWVIEGVHIVSGGSDGIAVQGDNNIIRDIDLSGGSSDGIDGGGVGNQVLDSTIHNFDNGPNDAHCIVLNPGAQDWVIRGNELFDCSGDGIQLYSQDPERSIVNTLISDNHIYFTGALSRTENAIDVKNADQLFIYNNLMHSFPDNKVVVFQKGPANIDMQCNVMYDGFTGVEFREEDGGTIENITFARNLMYGYSSYALKFDGTTNGLVWNNTFVDIGNDGLRIEGAGLGSGAVQNNVWVNTGQVEGGGFTADHNAFFNTGGVDISSASDVTDDPMLDPMYRIAPASPLVDAGVDVGLPFDGSAPDIGWYETNLDSCAATPTPGAGGGGAGGSGSGGDGGSTGPSPPLSGSGGGNAADGESDSGCGCRTAGGSDDHGAWVLLILVAAGTCRRRR